MCVCECVCVCVCEREREREREREGGRKERETILEGRSRYRMLWLLVKLATPGPNNFCSKYLVKAYNI